jgi:ABC-type Na+ transport system ATPase subunit NatA
MKASPSSSTSHDAGDIEHVADRVIVINNGNVVVDDSVIAVKKTISRRKTPPRAVPRTRASQSNDRAFPW